MKSNKLSTFFVLLCLLLSANCDSQVNLKSAKNTIKSEAKKELKTKTKAMSTNNPCDTNGMIQVAEGNKAFMSYKNCLKQLDVAERKIAIGDSPETSIKMVKRNMLSVLKKEPNADISDICNRLQQLEASAEDTVNDEDYFKEQIYIIKKVYRDADSEPYPENLGLEYPDWFLKDVKDFNREEVLSKAKTSNNKKAKEIIAVLNDYSAFIDRQGIDEYLMNLLDQYNSASSDQLAKKAKEINSVAKALKNFAGSNEGIERVIAFTDKQLAKGEAALVNIYSSEIHKKYINQVVFTKEPFKPGKEGSIDINPTFKTGDAVYGTVYLSASIKDAIDSWKGSGKGGTMGLKVKNSNGDFLNRKFEAWEVSSYSNYEVSISDGTNKEQTIIQFVLIPNKESSIKTEMSCNNITPILMARGLSLESERLKEYKVEITSSGKVTGAVTYKGSFKIDLTQGEGSNYYNEVENQKMEALLESIPIPTAKINNSALEDQLLAEMKKQGFQEQFKKAYIQANWQLFEPPLKEAYKEVTASFTYTTADGKCGWQNYSFRSFKTGSGWSSPQKWGGANQRQRLSCEKIK